MFPSAGKPTCGSLLFLNGRADAIEKYAETLHHWAGQGWQVESFDWRGQGGSGRFLTDPTVGHIEDFEYWLRDLQAYCLLWQEHSPPPHVIIAHSMGGHLLLRALAESRVKADAAVLVAPMLGIAAGGLPHTLASWLASMACALGLSRKSLWSLRHRTHRLMEALQTTLTHSRARFEQEVRLRRGHPELMMDAPSWGWLRAAYRSISMLWQPGYLGTVDTPLLILATKGDKLVSTPAIMRLSHCLPDARVHLYGRHVAHEILREVDSVRDDALDRIDQFLKEEAPAHDERDVKE